MEALVKKYLEQEQEDMQLSIAKDITGAITKGSQSVLQLMESMGEYLTSQNVDKRLKPLKLIASVILYLHESCLTPDQCAVLTEFLCCRLEDHFSLHPPTLNSLATLSARTDLRTGTAGSIMKAIFKEVHVPSYMQCERRAVFDTISNLLENYTSEMMQMNDEYVYGVITAVDGEQDPRNLLKVFDIMFSIVKCGFSLGKFAEEFFDVIGCYFPIDFEPPTNLSENKTIITNEQLVLGLRKVLTSSSTFAPYCIPLLIEKMESDVISAKVDAMVTLKECLKIYSSDSLKPHLQSLWSCLRTEAIEGKSKDTEELSVDLVKILAKLLSKSLVLSSAESEFNKFVSGLIETCLPRLSDSLQEKAAWSSGKLMVAVAEASESSCEKVLHASIPILMKSLKNKSAMIAEKRLSMELLVCFLKACSVHSFDHLDEHPLKKHKENILELFCDSTSSKEFVHLRTVALAGIAALCSLGLLITPEDQKTLSYNLTYCLQHENDNMILGDLFKVLGFLSATWPDVAINHILPVLKCELSRIFSSNDNDRRKNLDALCAISTNFELSSLTLGLLLEKTSGQNVNENDVEVVLSCLDAVCTIVKRNSENIDCLHYFADSLITPLIATGVRISLSSTSPEQCCSSCSGLQKFTNNCVTWPVMQKLSEILRTICQRLKSVERVNKISKTLSGIFIDGDTSLLGIAVSDSNPFMPLKNTRLPLQTRSTVLLMSTLPVFSSDTKAVVHLMQSLLLLCQDTIDQPSYASAAKCLAGLLNKNPNKDILDQVYKETSNCLFSSKFNDETRTAALSVLVWVTKALVIRSHPDSIEFCKILFRLFDDVKLGKMAADSFDIILRTPEEILNESCHACIRLMHKQRFFQLVLPYLKDGFQIVEEEEASAMEVDNVKDSTDNSLRKANCLSALSHLLHYLPKQVLNQHLMSLLPLLMKSLNSNEGPLLVSVLSTLFSLTHDAKSSLIPHVGMLLDRYLKLASYEGNMQVRLQALKCIGAMTLLRTDVILPYKKKMIRELSVTLDDKKRMVRKEAVKARTEWCLLGDV